MSFPETLGEKPKWLQRLVQACWFVADFRPVVMTASRRAEFLDAEWQAGELWKMRNECLEKHPIENDVVQCAAAARLNTEPGR